MSIVDGCDFVKTAQFFNGYPYSNYHEMNLDFILNQIKNLSEEMQNFIISNKIKFANPIEWNSDSTYEPSTVVMGDDGNTYISLKYVPKGIDYRNGEYWEKIADFNAQIENNKVYNPTSLSSVSNSNIGLKVGTYVVNDDMEINSQLVVPEGAYIKVNDGITLTINNSVLIGRYPVFIGNGKVIFTKQDVVYPEWFGALKNGTNNDSIAIQKAVDSIEKGIVSLASGSYVDTGNDIYESDGKSCYILKSEISIINKKVSLVGNGLACCFAYVSPAITIGSFENFIENADLKNCMIYYKGTQPTAYTNAMIRLLNTTRCTISGNRFYGSIYSMYVRKSLLLKICNNEFFSIVSSGSYSYGNAISVEGYTSDNSANSANASLTIEKNIMNFYNSREVIGERRGIYFVGDDLRDAFVRYNDISYCVGIFFFGVNSIYGMDIHIIGNIIDVSDMGIYMKDINNSTIEITGGWISIAGSDKNAILLENCNNATISNVELEGDLCTGESAGISALNCGAVNIQGCSFLNFYFGFRNINTLSSFISNSIIGKRNNFTQQTTLKFAIYNLSNVLNVLGNNIYSDGTLQYENALACSTGAIYSGLNNFGSLTDIVDRGVIHKVSTT